MARPRQFDREATLQRAIKLFWEQGYAATSTDALLRAMGIGRQSLYDTFGDKRSLYLEALAHYNAASVGRLIADMQDAASPLAGLEAALRGFAARSAGDAARGCMGINAVCEFGLSDPEVTALTEASARALCAALEKQLRAARAAGETDAELAPRAAAHFVASTLAGMKVSARGGATPAALKEIARPAVQGLRP
jgi:TetR/AcrR family transcriptional repressor of nem operon